MTVNYYLLDMVEQSAGIAKKKLKIINNYPNYSTKPTLIIISNMFRGRECGTFALVTRPTRKAAIFLMRYIPAS